MCVCVCFVCVCGRACGVLDNAPNRFVEAVLDNAPVIPGAFRLPTVLVPADGKIQVEVASPPKRSVAGP